MRIRLKDDTNADSPFWFLYFGGGSRNACVDFTTSLARVSKLSGDEDPALTSDDVWQVAPQSPPTACLERWGVEKKPEFCGVYSMPFAFELQARP